MEGPAGRFIPKILEFDAFQTLFLATLPSLCQNILLGAGLARLLILSFRRFIRRLTYWHAPPNIIFYVLKL